MDEWDDYGMPYDTEVSTGSDIGEVVTMDDLATDLYQKDPSYAAGSEVDYLGGAANILKTGTPIAAALLPKPPASVTPVLQKLIPGYSQGASTPPPQKTSPLIVGALIVGGIVLGVIVIGLGLKLARG